MKEMNMLKKWANRIFIDGLTGMAHGLFATLIIGTIIQQIGNLIGGDIGNYIFLIGKVAAALTGAGIGMKSDGKRNFEAGILTDSLTLVDAAAEHFNSVWTGEHCKNCKRKAYCGDKIERKKKR